TNQGRRFIPIRLDDTEPPEVLRPFAYIDWREAGDAEYERLLRVCHSPTEENASSIAPPHHWSVLQGHTGPVTSVAMTADGRRAASGSRDKTVRVWDLERGICLASLKGHRGSVQGMAMTADGRRAASGSADGTMRLWDL